METIHCWAEHIRIEPQGNTSTPTLAAYFEFHFSKKQGVSYNTRVNFPSKNPSPPADSIFIESIEAGLYWRTLGDTGNGRLLALGRMNPSGGSPFWVDLDADQTNQTFLLFPLSPQVMAQIEELRAGGDAMFGISMLVTGFGRAGVGGSPTALEPMGLSSLPVSLPKGAGSTLSVPRSEWIDTFLPRLKHGNWKTVEYPVVPIPDLGKIDDHIETATRHFRAGEWRSSVESSRLAIQECKTHILTVISPVFNDRPWTSKPKEARSKMETVLEAYAALSEKMVEFQASLFGLESPSTHPGVESVGWERPDAEFSLDLALAVRRYTGLRLKDPPKIIPAGTT